MLHSEEVGRGDRETDVYKKSHRSNCKDFTSSHVQADLGSSQEVGRGSLEDNSRTAGCSAGGAPFHHDIAAKLEWIQDSQCKTWIVHE